MCSSFHPNEDNNLLEHVATMSGCSSLMIPRRRLYSPAGLRHCRRSKSRKCSNQNSMRNTYSISESNEKQRTTYITTRIIKFSLTKQLMNPNNLMRCQIFHSHFWTKIRAHFPWRTDNRKGSNVLVTTFYWNNNLCLPTKRSAYDLLIFTNSC